MLNNGEIMKYRLKIPDHLRKEDYIETYRLMVLDGKYIEDNPKFYSSSGVRFADIPKDWLEPIVDGPVSAHDYRNYKSYGIPTTIGGMALLVEEIFKAGETNDRKRTQPVIDAAKKAVSVVHINGIEILRDALKTLEAE
jgi:hypothetical protein